MNQEAHIVAVRDERRQICLEVPLKWQEIQSRGKVAGHLIPTVSGIGESEGVYIAERALIS